MERKRPREFKAPAATAAFSIILVDGRRVRQKIKREYDKVARALEKARKEVEHFQQEDAPAYAQWFNRQFGPLLTELREASHRFRDLQQLLQEVESEMLHSGVGQREAYKRVMHRCEHPEAQKATFSEEEERGTGSERDRDSASDDEPWEQAKAFFENFFEFIEKGPARFAAKAAGRLKELYRALARRLHPDAQKDMTPQKEEWWHQAQAAYEAGDVEQLEVILTLCEVADTGTTEKTSLSALQRIIAQLKKTLRQIRIQVSQFRRDPAWNFKQRTDLSELEAELGRQMNYDLHQAKDALRMIEAEVAALARRVQRPRVAAPPATYLRSV